MSNSNKETDRKKKDLPAAVAGGVLKKLSKKQPKANKKTVEKAGSAITARGTERGLVLRIDGRVEWEKILAELDAFLGTSRKFFEGGQICIEWMTRMPSKELCLELEKKLKEEYDLEIAKGAKTAEKKKLESPLEESLSEEDPLDNVLGSADVEELDEDDAYLPDEDAFPLLVNETTDGVGSADVIALSRPGSASEDYVGRVAQMLGDEALLENENNARIVYSTLRSGQRVETPYNLVVVGDVNPGADLVAGGDIIVLGSLRGTAHAGAYDEDIQDRVVIALHMQPMQLRIGSIISRGSDDMVQTTEIARIEERRIVVEAYAPRHARKNKIA